jgi:hypothetical protein
MANSRGRRTIRRLLQEGGLGLLLKPTLPPPVPKTIPFWKKIPTSVYSALAVLALLIALSQGYPWLSVEESGLLDPSDPYSQMFKLSNGGYVPVTDVIAWCSADTVVNGNVFKDDRIGQPLAGYLGHDGSVTLPCFEIFQMKRAVVPSGSMLKISLTYAFFHLNWKPLRRSQEFNFRSIVGRDNSQHWIFVN